MSIVCVVGGGPAGSTFAARMAQLGHEVWLVERAQFPRRHLGEALTPGVLPLLEMTGARAAIEAAAFRPVSRVRVKWDAGRELREDGPQGGMIVDRGEFDWLLLERARALGARILQPATVHEQRHDGDRWKVAINTVDGVVERQADLLVDATGRASARSVSRRWAGAPTLALYAYWRATELPTEPSIEAGSEAWYWGVPLPDGIYNTLIFADARRLREQPGSLTDRFLQLLSRSAVMEKCANAELATPVSAINATPYLDLENAGPGTLKIGDAALALDPLSSSGVQKAIQGALSGAIVANTLLRRAEMTEAALQFYRTSLAEASRRHGHWAGGHYARVAAVRGGTFWRDRAGNVEEVRTSAPRATLSASMLSSTRVDLSRELEFVDLPCIEGEFVTLKAALRHPTLDGPLSYLGGRELAPLLRGLPAGLTPMQIAQSWSDRVPLDRGLSIAGWMLNRGLFISHADDRRESEQ
jgi:flavin-dependent dehydrogenase